MTHCRVSVIDEIKDQIGCNGLIAAGITVPDFDEGVRESGASLDIGVSSERKRGDVLLCKLY